MRILAPTGPLRRFIVLVVTVGVIVSVGASTAGAADYSSDAFVVRSRLARWNVSPVPTLPAVIPGSIDCCSAELKRSGKNYTVNYSALEEGEPGFIVSFSRLDKSWFRKMIHFARHTQKHPVRPERVGGRTMQFARTDITFWYLWKEQGRAYLLSSKYYGGVSRGQLRKMAASVGPVGTAYRGKTSQGQPIEVYEDRSHKNGVFGANVRISLECGLAGSSLFWTEAYDEFRIDKSGNASGSYADTIRDESGDTSPFDTKWDAKFAGDSVSGTVSLATSANGCASGSVTWSAASVPRT